MAHSYANRPHSHYDHYLESEVLSADPVKLVLMLYRAAIEATATARRHLAAGEIRERSRQITRAWRIVRELSRSLDPQAGGEIGAELARLYPYMQRRLIEANMHQIDAPLAEVEQLLTTLLEGWSSISAERSEAASEYESVSCSY
ncbi:MAG TPA: flagellar export chaperone FliS [Bryobacteraceae bacterium]|nr:flagellar export chaperone FliS [Bryobacteraceae bacterium]